ncbi:MAG TPA: DUF5947 family protein [Chloroflexia bacterium]|nr:DUF5947 family protein [Chloroflexia bacterium]
MNQNPTPPAPDAFGTLRRFVRPRQPAERCDLCAVPLAPEHQHLLDPQTRQLLCACDPCALLFSSQEGTRYRRVSRRRQALADFRLTDGQWDALLIPVGMAFFFTNSAEARVMALYPSPAGPTESLLPLEAWTEIVAENPVLAEMLPDVEALLVNRVRGHQDYYLVPIDECYRLVGLIRVGWRGLSGGADVWREIDGFFAQLQQRCGGPAAPAPERGDARA